MKTILSLALAVLTLGLFTERAHGAVIIEMADGIDGNSIDFSFSGTLDTTGLTSWHYPSTSGWANVYFAGGNFMTFYPSGAGLVKGGTAATLVISNKWFDTKLTGGYNVSNYAGADAFGIQYSDHSIILPLDYQSGDLLSGAGSIVGLTLADLKPFDNWVGNPTSGVIATLPGGDTIELRIIPEPSTTSILAGGLALATLLVRWKQRVA